MTVYSQSSWGTYACGISSVFAISTYTAFTSNNLKVDLLNFGMSSTTTLNVKLQIQNIGASFTMVMPGYNSYPWFRFYL